MRHERQRTLEESIRRHRIGYFIGGLVATSTFAPAIYHSPNVSTIIISSFVIPAINLVSLGVGKYSGESVFYNQNPSPEALTGVKPEPITQPKPEIEASSPLVIA